MAHETAGSSEPESLLGQCICLLSQRNFSSARKQALSPRRTHPYRREFAKVLAVADVHLAAQKRLPREQSDWLSILQVESPPAVGGGGGGELVVKTQVRKLLILLNPKENKLPFAQEAFELVCNAWCGLSDTQMKIQLKVDDHGPEMPETSGSGEKKMGDDGGSFWTVCPYCYSLHEYEAIYKDCCLRCQDCRRAFHGVEVPPPEADMVVEGKEQYYCVFGCFPLWYKSVGSSGDNGENSNGGGGDDAVDDVRDNSFLDGKKGNSSASNKDGFVEVVEISDDDSDEDSGIGKTGKGEIGKTDGVGLEKETGKKVMMEEEEEEEEQEEEEGVQGSMRVGEQVGTLIQGSRKIEILQNGKKVIRNVKSAARNTKKLMGRGQKYRRVERGDGASGIGGESGTGFGTGSDFGHVSLEGDLMFFIGEDDVYVDINNAD